MNIFFSCSKTDDYEVFCVLFIKYLNKYFNNC